MRSLQPVYHRLGIWFYAPLQVRLFDKKSYNLCPWGIEVAMMHCWEKDEEIQADAKQVLDDQ
jgi:hypothetical protein